LTYVGELISFDARKLWELLRLWESVELGKLRWLGELKSFESREL